MKAVAVTVMTAMLGLAVGSEVVAQQRDPQREPARPKVERQTFQKPEGVMESRQLVGTKVKGSDGKDLGEIDQFLVDKDGKVTHAVIGVGGLLGVGESHVVVPWSDVKL